MAEFSFTGETVLLWLALALAATFLGVLVLDRVTRGRRRRRHLHRPAGRRESAGNLFSRTRALWGELKEVLQERSRRGGGRGRRPPRTLG